jgi:nucleoside-diphosphate-sugar epimerase
VHVRNFLSIDTKIVSILSSSKKTGIETSRRINKLYGIDVDYYTDLNELINGSRGRHDMFVWRIFNSIITGDQIQKYGTGDGVRDWLYISDAIDAVFSLLHTEIKFDALNIGVSEMTSTNKLIGLCEEIAKEKANIVNIPAIRGDAVFAGIADCTKIHKICGWKAKVKILEGLKKTYD